MDAPTIAALVAVCALGLNIIMSVRGGSWGLADRLSEMEARIMGAIDLHKTRVDKDVKAVEAKIESAERSFGETAHAMQAKIHEIEKWARDEFVRKGSFEHVMTRIEMGQAKRDESLEKRLDRMDAKLDELQARKN